MCCCGGRQGSPLSHPNAATFRQLALTSGVQCFVAASVHSTDEMLRYVEHELIAAGKCITGDKIAIVAGSPPGTPGRTNALRLHQIGETVASS